ncbi:HupE/UreJ family protein [Noviherbaspirillum aridicola]|uniref:Protein hupE n=1 Tax=Noviherbaspirillum aridicola TaxID=2849687 RepID=A0ABQ4Q9C1_9BURK|nr:HupE/UreJ family protein [Noviherbaspirillum aridicola]GIZ53819.1 protein hupE [Noviherbaspirillum aridicola]
MPRPSVALRSLALIAVGLLAAPAFAHPGAHHAAGLSSGFLHPLSGWDHLLAMLAAGVWAAQQRRMAWSLLALFPAAMAFGALLAFGGFSLPLVEPGIAASVLVLGLTVAFAVRMPALAGGALVALFAMCHGFAHGAELPAQTSAAGYAAGFLAATLALHLAGAAGSRLLQGLHAAIVRAAGAGVAFAGAWMLAAI